jgi:hypothetical protein
MSDSQLPNKWTCRIDPRFLDLGSSWRWVVSFTSLPLYPRGKKPRYPLDGRQGGPQSQSGRYGEVKILGPTGTRTWTPSVVQPVASRYADWATVYHFLCSSFSKIIIRRVFRFSAWTPATSYPLDDTKFEMIKLSLIFHNLIKGKKLEGQKVWRCILLYGLYLAMSSARPCSTAIQRINRSRPLPSLQIRVHYSLIIVATVAI